MIYFNNSEFWGCTGNSREVWSEGGISRSHCRGRRFEPCTAYKNCHTRQRVTPPSGWRSRFWWGKSGPKLDWSRLSCSHNSAIDRFHFSQSICGNHRPVCSGHTRWLLASLLLHCMAMRLLVTDQPGTHTPQLVSSTWRLPMVGSTQRPACCCNPFAQP
jgi:hypothetical protein